MKRFYRAALKGDEVASRYLLTWAVGYIERGEKMPSGLGRYVARILKTPNVYARHMGATNPEKKKRGRPRKDGRSDDRRDAIRLEFLYPKRFERATDGPRANALMVAYLHSQGHPVSYSSRSDKEPALELVAEIVGKSVRSVQNDYLARKATINESGIGLGALIYKLHIARRG